MESGFERPSLGWELCSTHPSFIVSTQINGTSLASTELPEENYVSDGENDVSGKEITLKTKNYV